MYDRVPHAGFFHIWGAPGRTTRAAAEMELVASILGSGKNSRLYQALIYDQQLAVDASSSLQGQELVSMFDIDVTLQSDASMDRVNAIIERELQNFIDAGPTPEELQRVQTRINARVVRGLEQIGGFGGKAVTLAQSELYADDPGFWKTRLEWINGATPESVKATAAEWLSRGRYKLEIYPFADFTTSESSVDRTAGLPPVGAMPDLVFPDIERAELENGLKVVLATRNAVPVVNISLQFDAGYAADSFGTLGAASFAMAMLDEGTATRDALQIAAEAESLGAFISTDSDLDTSMAYLSALKSQLQPSLDLFSEIVKEPAFPDEELVRLRKRWIAGIGQEKNEPVQLALRTLPLLMYGDDHAYGIPFTGSGTEASINALTRDELVSWHQTWIRPSNGTLFVVGDTTMEEILPLLNQYFGSWKENRMAVPEKNIAEVAMREGAVYLIDKPGAPQSLILAGHVAPATGVDNNIDILTMNDVIGGSFTARVNMNLREDKGWAYGAYTFMQDARGQRPWLAYAPVQTDKTADSIKELKREMDEFLNSSPARQDELDKSVRNNVNSLPGQFETAGAVLDALLSNDRFGRPDDYVSSLKSRYEAVDLAAVRAAAAQVIHPDNLIWLIVGDLEQIEQPIRELGLGDIQVIDEDGRAIPLSE